MKLVFEDVFFGGRFFLGESMYVDINICSYKVYHSRWRWAKVGPFRIGIIHT